MEPLFKVGDVVPDRSGRSCRVICTDRFGDYPIVTLVNINGLEEVRSFTADGKFCLNFSESSSDLLPPEKVVWVNIYADGRYCQHNTRKDADDRAWSDRIARKKVVYRPGEMDE